MRFALAYRFAPGSEDDGVTLLVPQAALNQIDPHRCDWLVPGLLEEKITALIKGLPQSVRRAFVPVPEFAHAAAEALSPPVTAASPQPLAEALADFLQRRTGQEIPRDAWRPENLPLHLRMNYRVLDPDNRILAEGRDLAELRRQLGGEASRSLQLAVAPEAPSERLQKALATAGLAASLDDLAALPGNRFEGLKGDRRGQYSIRIHDQWRVCFEWPRGAPGPSNVEIVDYH